MTTHAIKDKSLRTIFWFEVAVGPTREYANEHSSGTFAVNMASVVIDTTASEEDQSQWTAYLSGPSSHEGQVYSEVVHQRDVSDETMQWLGPIVKDALAKHEAAMVAIS